MQQHNLNSKIDNYCNELEVLSSKMADFFHIGNYNEIYNIDLQRKEILKEISKDVTKLSNNNREKIKLVWVNNNKMIQSIDKKINSDRKNYLKKKKTLKAYSFKN